MKKDFLIIVFFAIYFFICVYIIIELFKFRRINMKLLYLKSKI